MLSGKFFYVLLFSSIIPLITFGQSDSQFTRDSSILINKIIVNYDSDSYELQESDKQIISDFISDQDVTSLFFDIKAYTDSDGSNSYNIKLSENRSNEVEQFLISSNLIPEQIVSHAYGESTIDGTEYSETEKALNRKTEITVFQKLQYVLLSGSVTSQDSSRIEGAELNIYDEGVKRNVVIGKDNKFSVPIPIDRKIELHFIAKDHFPYVKRLKLTENAKPRDIQFPMKKMEMGAVLRMNLRFEGGLSIILDYSERELEALYNTLALNQNICVELAGHINMPNVPPVKQGTENYDLSIARSLEVKKYLTDRNISEDRLLSRGYGSSQMIYPKAVLESKMIENRRVEAIVASCDTTRLLLDDSIDDMERFRIPSNPIQRKYNPESIKKDLSAEKEQRVAKEIVAQVAFLDSIGMDPTRYTYMELLMHYRDRTRDK